MLSHTTTPATQSADFAAAEAPVAAPSDVEPEQTWQGDVYGVSDTVGPQDLYTLSPEFEMVGAGRDTGLQANYDFLHSSNPTEQMILDAGMARAFSINQLGALDLSAPGPMTEGGGFSDHFFGRLDNAWESLKSTGALIRDASGFGDDGSFTRTWTALGEASVRSNKFIGSVVAGQIPFNDLLFPEIAQYRRDVASEFVTSIADRYTLAYKDGGWSAVAGEGVGDLFVLGVEALATKGAGRVVSSLSRLDRLFKLDLDGPVITRINSSQRLLDESFDPIPFDQGVLDHIVQTDPALSNVRLSARPQISIDLPDGTIGRSRQAYDWETNIFTDISEIGPGAFRNRNSLIGTIAHEETHLRFGHKLKQGNERYLRMDSLGVEEDYVRRVEARFLRMQERAER